MMKNSAARFFCVFAMLLLVVSCASCSGAQDNEGGFGMKEYIYLEVGEETLKVKLEDNASVRALLGLLQNGPVSMTASNYGGFEKVCRLGRSLPSSDVYMETEPGDVCLYASSQIVIFHGSNAWEYTRLGRIEGKTQAELKAALSGSDNVVVVRL